MLLTALTLLACSAPVQEQTSAQRYTRYELLDPNSSSFRILYDVSATTPGATSYFNSVRSGSEVSDVAVFDRASGARLEHEIVEGTTAREVGYTGARDDGRYIQVTLPRAVPDGGEVRIRIEKTYTDAASYHSDGDDVIFERSLGIRRNSVLLPEGHELVGCNIAAQVLAETSGRTLVSFMNTGLPALPVELRMRKLRSHDGTRPRPSADPAGQIGEAPPLRAPGSPPDDYAYTERANQDRDIVYFLKSPETHSFRLYHDYTERRPGIDKYLNVVRAGSKASDPEAIILDTGEKLRIETLRGEEVTRANLGVRSVTDETEVVVIHFPAVKEGHNVRLRIEETYTDSSRYGLMGEELVWARSFGRNRNRVVLPAGWRLTDNSIPAVVSLARDGRIQLDYVNPRPDSIYVVVKARLR